VNKWRAALWRQPTVYKEWNLYNTFSTFYAFLNNLIRKFNSLKTTITPHNRFPNPQRKERGSIRDASRWMLSKVCFFVFGATAPHWARASSFTRFLDQTQWRTTVGGTSLDKWSARHRDVYLTPHNTHNRQTSMPSVLFQPTFSVGERPQTHALDRAATGTGAV
jgi:hypothetical protein